MYPGRIATCARAVNCFSNSANQTAGNIWLLTAGCWRARNELAGFLAPERSFENWICPVGAGVGWADLCARVILIWQAGQYWPGRQQSTKAPRLLHRAPSCPCGLGQARDITLELARPGYLAGSLYCVRGRRAIIAATQAARLFLIYTAGRSFNVAVNE